MADKTGNEEEMQGELPLEDTTPDYKQQIKDLEKQRNEAQKTVKYIEKNRKTQGARVYSDDDYEKAKSKVASLEMELAEAKEAQKAEKKKNSEQKKTAIKEKVNNAIDSVATIMGANASGALTEAAINKAQGGSGSVLQTSVAGGIPQSKPIKSGSEDQQKDIVKLGKVGEDVISDTLSESENTVRERQKALKKYLDEYIDASANSKIYNELPRTIRQAYKSGEFGDPVDEKIRKDYREVMRKPKKDRDEKDKETIDAYKKELERTKDARQARDWYTMNAIGTALLNVGTALKGGTPTAETAWNKRQGARIEAAQQRYKDLLDTKANAVIEDAKHLQGFNQEMEKGIRKLYADRRLQPILNELDVNSQRQLIDLMQEKAGAINFETFKSALLMSIIDNPGGAVASVFGAGKELIDAAK